MTTDPYDVRAWLQAPEAWIIIVLSTFFACTTLLNAAILPRILPADRLEQQMLSDPRVTQFVLGGAKYLCDANGLALIGFSFSVDGASRLPADRVQGTACWNFGKADGISNLRARSADIW